MTYHSSQEGATDAVAAQRRALTLGEFMRTHTSEDNKAFADLQTADEETRRKKYVRAWSQKGN